MDLEKQSGSPRMNPDFDDNNLENKTSRQSITEARDRWEESDELDKPKSIERRSTDVESSPGETNRQSAPPPDDPSLVTWDGPNDPENPLNLPLWRKWVMTMALAFTCLWVTFASSVFSEATVATSIHFHVSTEVMTLGTSLMVLGYMVGPLIWGPLSELYGRKVPLFSGYLVFAVFQIPVAVAQNVETIMLCRFIQGVFGCSPLCIVAGAMADFWDPISRGVAIAMFAAATFLGPILGPIM